MDIHDKQARAQLQGMVAFLQKLSESGASELTMTQLLILLQTAANNPDDTPMAALGAVTEQNAANVSRSAYALSDWSYLKKTGIGFVSVKENIQDRRFKLLGLSPKGAKVVKEALEALNKKADATLKRLQRS